MHWLNLQTALLASPEVRGSSCAQIGAWTLLLAYCATQENGGTVSGCGEWPERKFWAVLGFEKAELSACDLWAWEGADLRVWGYPVEKEQAMERMRQAGREGGKKGGKPTHKAPLPEQETPPLTPPFTPPLNGSPPPAFTHKGKERKGKEEEVKSSQEDGQDGQVSISIQTLQSARACAVLNGLPADAAAEWWERSGSTGLDAEGQPLRNPRAALLAWCREWQSREGSEAAPPPSGGPEKKLAAPIPAEPADWQARVNRTGALDVDPDASWAVLLPEQRAVVLKILAGEAA